MKKFLIIAILALSQVACNLNGSSDLVGADGMSNNKLIRVPNVETQTAAAQDAGYVSRSTSIR